MAWRGLPKIDPRQQTDDPPGADHLRFPTDAVAGLCVLASGSSGNCTVLVVKGQASTRPERVVLLDAGLSPGRTRALLAARGIAMRWVDDIVVTHLDRDHFHHHWKHARDCHATLRLHRRHVARAQRDGRLLRRNEPFDDGPHFDLGPNTRASSELLAHDQLGVAALRIDTRGHAGDASLGFATDLGRVTDGLVRHLTGVDVLAIESNYCPDMQHASDRPAFLKQRITGGAGHLSNHEAADAVHRIAPRAHAVFLHISRQCNEPSRVAALHRHADYEWTIASQHEPSRWVWLAPAQTEQPRPTQTASQHTLPDPRPDPQTTLFDQGVRGTMS